MFNRYSTPLLAGFALLAATGCARLEFSDDGKPTGPPPGKEPTLCEQPEAVPYCPPYGTQCYENAVYSCDDDCGHPVGQAQKVCGKDERCDTDGVDAFCRPCEEGECPDESGPEPEPTECDPTNLQPFCSSWNTHMRCQADGTWSNETTCAANQRCNRGLCNNGNDVGSTCQTDANCRGAFCICATGYSASNPDECLGSMSYGFCTNRSCLTDGCPDSQFCASFVGLAQARGGSICLDKGTCTERDQLCAAGNRVLRCSEVPVKAEGADGPRTWELACFTMSLREIGDSCTGNAQCAGGECLLRNVGNTQVRYCTNECNSNEECPSYAACVITADQPTGICARKASECSTRLAADSNISTRTLQDVDGNTVDVCYY